MFREEHGRAVAVLVRVFGDIDIAEDAVQDAFTVAAERWPAAGLPPPPVAAAPPLNEAGRPVAIATCLARFSAITLLLWLSIQ